VNSVNKRLFYYILIVCLFYILSPIDKKSLTLLKIKKYPFHVKLLMLATQASVHCCYIYAPSSCFCRRQACSAAAKELQRKRRRKQPFAFALYQQQVYCELRSKKQVRSFFFFLLLLLHPSAFPASSAGGISRIHRMQLYWSGSFKIINY
jgi:hypothetical protein